MEIISQQVLNGFLAKHMLLFPYICVKNKRTVIPRRSACNWSQGSLDSCY